MLNIWFTLQWHEDLPGKKRGKTLFSSSWQLEKRRRWQEALEAMTLVAVIQRFLDLKAIEPLNNRINVPLYWHYGN